MGTRSRLYRPLTVGTSAHRPLTVKAPAPLSLPARWQGCEHVVPCACCEARGWVRGALGRVSCPECRGRGVAWNGTSLPASMEAVGYRVKDGEAYWRNVPLCDQQVCANLWLFGGEK